MKEERIYGHCISPSNDRRFIVVASWAFVITKRVVPLQCAILGGSQLGPGLPMNSQRVRQRPEQVVQAKCSHKGPAPSAHRLEAASHQQLMNVLSVGEEDKTGVGSSRRAFCHAALHGATPAAAWGNANPLCYAADRRTKSGPAAVSDLRDTLSVW